ncbi:hypothetical protein GW17_00004361 [Ensete ventricosum]|uniref:Uncharacterized protein n=1 Tax=Ensete ventricosum TaxID=4639 RepID=A0A444G806_ENSVE|nr:hypothetical protein B296_00026874 [Ensete ventricosum]RWW31033.1 hypothetical protein GW17_00004361 [Ensete ventricosum]
MCLFLSRRLKLQIQCKKVSSISWTHWFKKMLYYQVALVYTLTRLVTNVSQVNIFHCGFSLVSHFLFFPRQVTGISMESMLVGENLNGCAFVYGSLSFVDKLSCGLALFVLESYQGKRVTSFPIRSPPDNNIFSSGSPDVMGNLGSNVSHSVNRYGLGVIPATCAFVSAVITYTMELPDTTSSRTLVEPLLA